MMFRRHRPTEVSEVPRTGRKDECAPFLSSSHIPCEFNELRLCEVNPQLDIVKTVANLDLKTLKLTASYQGRTVPTIGGLLLFGSDRLDRFPDAWIQAGRFAGRDERKILDSMEVRSPLPSAAEDVLAFLRKHSSREAVIGRVKRTDLWTLPPVALREAVINAIVHADYAQRGAPIRVSLFEDRLEIENPGLLPLGLTIEDIQQGISKLRNRVIGRFSRNCGLSNNGAAGFSE